MRRHPGVSLLLFLALLTFSTSSLVPSARGQAPLETGSPRTPLLTYYDQPPGPSGYWPQGKRSAVELYYSVVGEGDAWKLVLSPDETAEMQKLPSRVTVKRYGPNTTASNRGLTLRVLEAALGKDTTTLRLSLQNAGDTEARVLNALSLATLTDDSGAIHDTRILRSTFPETVPAGTSTLVTLIFEPAPHDSKKLLLALSGIRMGEEEFPLAADIVLVP